MIFLFVCLFVTTRCVFTIFSFIQINHHQYGSAISVCRICKYAHGILPTEYANTIFAWVYGRRRTVFV